MAFPDTFVVDASVVVKWLNRENESYTDEAKDVLIGAAESRYTLAVSDLTIHEVFNALIRGKQLNGVPLKDAIDTYFSFPLHVIQTTRQIASTAALIAERDAITFYDAVYCAAALHDQSPLITANPKHQRSSIGIDVIPINQWFAQKINFYDTD